MTEQTTHPTGLDRFFHWCRSLGLRRTAERRVAGVSVALARRAGIDPLIVRILFVVGALLGGVGVAAYLLLWLVSPGVTDELPVELALREGDTRSVLLLVATGLVVLGNGPWDWHDDDGETGLGWLLVGILAVAWFVRRRRYRALEGAPAVPPPPGPAGSTAVGSPTAPLPTATPETTAPLGDAAGAALPAGQRAGYSGWTGTYDAVTPVTYPRRRRRGPGGLLVLATTGAMAVAAGLVLLAERGAGWSFSGVPLAAAAALAVAGLAILGAGLAGRRTGFLSMLAALALVSTVATTLAPPVVWQDGPSGHLRWTADAAQQDAKYHLRAGDGRLDLTPLRDGSRSTPRHVQVTAGAGELRLVIPRDTTVEVRAKIGLGALYEGTHAAGSAVGMVNKGSERNDGSRQLMGGGNLDFLRAYGRGEPQLVVDATVGVGDIVIVTEED